MYDLLLKMMSKTENLNNYEYQKFITQRLQAFIEYSNPDRYVYSTRFFDEKLQYLLIEFGLDYKPAVPVNHFEGEGNIKNLLKFLLQKKWKQSKNYILKSNIMIYLTDDKMYLLRRIRKNSLTAVNTAQDANALIRQILINENKCIKKK